MTVGYLVLEAAHTIGIIHNLTVLVLLGDRAQGIASTIFETCTTVGVFFEIIEVI